MTKQEFYAQLHVLKTRFEHMPPELELTVRDSAIGVEGHVVVWNTKISEGGPLPNCAKGGTRLREGLSLEETKMLARTMAIKNAAADLPLGGAKSGMNANPKSPGFEKQYRRFVQLCKPMLYENGGVFGGFGFDIGAHPDHAVWACATLNSSRSFTGKPASMGGTDYDKEGIAGLGVAVCANTMLELSNQSAANARYAVHGIGAMGAAVVRYFTEAGAQLVAIGDPKYGGTWSFTAPISSELLRALVTQQTDAAQVLLHQEASFVSDKPNDVLFSEVDVLFPCALHSVITTENVDRIQCALIVEGANGPCEKATIAVLQSRGIPVVPDFIANSGGIIAAFVELTSDLSTNKSAQQQSIAEQAKALTRSKIKHNVQYVDQLSKKYKVSHRDAGFYLALNKILAE